MGDYPQLDIQGETNDGYIIYVSLPDRPVFEIIAPFTSLLGRIIQDYEVASTEAAETGDDEAFAPPADGHGDHHEGPDITHRRVGGGLLLGFEEPGGDRPHLGP